MPSVRPTMFWRRIGRCAWVSCAILASCDDPIDVTPIVPPDNRHERLVWTGPAVKTFGHPSAGDGRAFVKTFENEVVAVSLEDGSVLWRVTPPTTPRTLLGQGTLYADGLVIACVGTLYALDAATGAMRWHFDPSTGRNPGLFLPAVSDDALIAGSSSGHVIAIDLASGAERWRTEVVSRDPASVYQPVVRDDTIFVAFTEFLHPGIAVDLGGVAALDLRTGRRLWRTYLPHTESGDSPTATTEPAVAGGVVIAGARDGPVHALSTSTGSLLWTIPPIISGSGSPPVIRDYRPLAATESMLIVGTNGDTLLGVSPTSGEVLWRFTHEFGSTGWLRAEGDDVFLVYGAGQMDVIDGRSGALSWRSETPVSAFPPAVAGSLLITTGDSVRAFRR